MSGIDDTAGFALARATRTHKTLTSLDLSHNAITAAATMVRWPQVAVLCLSWPYPRAVVGSDARIGGSGVPDAEDRVLGCMQPWPPRSPSHCTRAHATRRAHGVSAVPRVHGWVQHDGAWSGYRHHCDPRSHGAVRQALTRQLRRLRNPSTCSTWQSPEDCTLGDAALRRMPQSQLTPLASGAGMSWILGTFSTSTSFARSSARCPSCRVRPSWETRRNSSPASALGKSTSKCVVLASLWHGIMGVRSRDVWFRAAAGSRAGIGYHCSGRIRSPVRPACDLAHQPRRVVDPHSRQAVF